ncbi:hypothetical protein EDF38_1987 [Frigoribacterium sp. PhB160]|uniref:hypothetical protein n=1 Tax=Frigoribacterium sp. PhB160 TaxID=2485192 RepID=UPI000F45F94D|nr:hypothetical protein [Frigoribacterium sp. PhB160]ROS59147.1 hypothetical protein EDF38_1987 [Frigoribacterium sp. PhB160]
MTRGTQHAPARRRHARRLGAGLATATAVALVAAGCTSAPEPVDDPSKVLQTVVSTLATDGAVTAVDSTTISVDERAGTSSSTTASFAPADVADDLPVRVTTQYRAGDSSGTDLADLEGYTGRVEIDLTVENLTVAPTDVSYDVAGSSRTDTALVGAPLSIAASTVLEGTSPSSVMSGQGSTDGGTNGIVSTTDDGDAVVQWGTLLAPPRSGASTTLSLVADVDDFRTPTIDLAAQPGITTDLSVDGVLGGAFDSGSTSELALQQRTIDLISEVNTVLSRAGGTITEVRTNLESTSETLGVRTAEQLRDSSTSLAGTMQGLSGQLASLETDLGGTVEGTGSAVRSQLQQTVASVDALLGDTEATAPVLQLDRAGCATEVPAPGDTASVYGSLLQVSAQLDGYAGASEACRDEVAASLAATVGPTDPTVESCTGQPSLTCALFASSLSVTGALIGLVTDGADLVDDLQPEAAQAALDRYADLAAQLDSVDDQLTALSGDVSDDEVATSLRELDDAVDALSTGLPTLRAQVDAVHDTAVDARRQIGDVDARGSMQAQNARLAAELCDVIDDEPFGSGLSRAEVERLRAYLTDERCALPEGGGDGGDQGDGDGDQGDGDGDQGDGGAGDADGGAGDPEGEPGTGTGDETVAPAALDLDLPLPDLGVDPMSERLADQAAAWDQVVAATDLDDAEAGLGRSLAALEATATRVQDVLDDVEDAVAAGDGSLDEAVAALQETTATAQDEGTQLLSSLEALKTQQDALAEGVQDAFDDAASDAGRDITALVGEQVRVVAAQGTTSRESVVAAFDASIAGLSTTSDVVVGDARDTIEGQRGDLAEQTDGLTQAVDEQTAASLERIAQSTATSTRDVEGASTLLAADLGKVLLDLGDRTVNGSGILGAMATSAAKADTADFQLALASQNASGYANVRAEDVAGIMLRQAQFAASLDAASSLPAFHLDVPAGATSSTLYSFRVGGDR